MDHSVLKSNVPLSVHAGNLCRLKMFREEQGTWMIMLLTMVIFVYMFSLVYNFFLMSAYPEPELFRINAFMGITNANFMKFAACGTWLGDFLTAWMVTSTPHNQPRN